MNFKDFKKYDWSMDQYKTELPKMADEVCKRVEKCVNELREHAAWIEDWHIGGRLISFKWPYGDNYIVANIRKLDNDKTLYCDMAMHSSNGDMINVQRVPFDKSLSRKEAIIMIGQTTTDKLGIVPEICMIGDC